MIDWPPPITNTHRGPPSRQNATILSPISSPALSPGERPVPPSLRLSVPGAASSSSPLSPFPAYTEYPWPAQISSRPASLRPRSPSASPESVYPRDSFEVPDQSKIPHWWPSKVLPSPYVLLSTLFPTLTNWRDKNIFEKVMGAVASVPVFLLTITLPVVEPEKGEDEASSDELSLEFSLPPPLTPLSGDVSLVLSRQNSGNINLRRHKKPRAMPEQRSSSGSITTATLRTPQVYITDEDMMAQSPEQLDPPPSSSESKEWNRWLVFVQIFTAPLFIVIIIWANLEPDDAR